MPSPSGTAAEERKPESVLDRVLVSSARLSFEEFRDPLIRSGSSRRRYLGYSCGEVVVDDRNGVI